MTEKHVLIIGAGCFGLSTALHLLKHGDVRITILDRATDLPAVDAASTDINKIVRSSYSDPFYASLAKEAIAEWKDGTWGQGDTQAYHESGVLVLGSKSRKTEYIDNAFQLDHNMGSRVEKVPDRETATKHFPTNVEIGLHESAGYLNRDGGWAYAKLGVVVALEKVRALGAEILTGRQVSELLVDDNGIRVLGVRCASGEVVKADVTVIATGAWTGSLFPSVDLGVGNSLLATGQSLATIQLSKEEEAKYAACPVVLNFETGFYIFPPNEDGLVKLAIHHAGYVFPQPRGSSESGTMGVSTPRTVVSHPKNGKAIPRHMVETLRAGLVDVYPALADRPFEGTRLCWYSDTEDGNFLIDYHPKHAETLLFASGGSGHAYKFLPVLGRLVAARLLGTMDPETKARFALDRKTDGSDSSRPGQVPHILKEDELTE